MVQAVVSATKRCDAMDVLSAKRMGQMEKHHGKPLNPILEAGNLQALLEHIGESHQIEVKSVSSTDKLRRLVEIGDDIFVGFASGPDSPPHIAHLGQRVLGGFSSKQQFTGDDEFTIQFMEQDQITVFLRKR